MRWRLICSVRRVMGQRYWYGLMFARSPRPLSSLLVGFIWFRVLQVPGTRQWPGCGAGAASGRGGIGVRLVRWLGVRVDVEAEPFGACGPQAPIDGGCDTRAPYVTGDPARRRYRTSKSCHDVSSTWSLRARGGQVRGDWYKVGRTRQVRACSPQRCRRNQVGPTRRRRRHQDAPYPERGAAPRRSRLHAPHHPPLAVREPDHRFMFPPRTKALNNKRSSARAFSSRLPYGDGSVSCSAGGPFVRVNILAGRRGKDQLECPGS